MNQLLTETNQLEIAINETPQVRAVKENGYSIRYINNPSEYIKELAVKQNGCAIKHIDNPSEKIQELAVKQNGCAIQYINNPSEKIRKLTLILHPEMI